MSKKLLALLVAVSTCCAFGCSDDDSDSCKTGEKRCDGNNAQICVNGNWSKGTPCADGCDKATGVCTVPPATCKTAGEKRCSGKELQECKDGNWSKVEVCKDSCDEATKACKDGGSGTIPEVGSPCDKSTFQQVCINGGANALVCWNDVVTKWNCANNDCKANAEKPLQVICAKGTDELPSDVPTTCVKGTSKGMCSAENNQPYICGDNGYYKGKCESGTCFACSDGWVGCGATEADVCKTQTTCTGEKVPTGGEEGACCDAATYQVSCINENANALICAKGAVKKWTCKDNICSGGSDNKVKCDNPNGTGGGSGTGGSQPTTCTGEKVQTGGEEGTCCDAATYQVSCINENANALICAKGAVKKWTCKDNICSVGSDNKVKCDNPNGTGGGSDTGKTCDKATTNPVCNEAGDKVTYCSSSNELKEKDCPQCYVNGSIFWCNGDQNLTNCVKGGNTKCKGNCVSDTLGYIWNKDENMVKEYTCTAPKKCTDNGAGYLSCK